MLTSSVYVYTFTRASKSTILAEGAYLHLLCVESLSAKPSPTVGVDRKEHQNHIPSSMKIFADKMNVDVNVKSQNCRTLIEAGGTGKVSGTVSGAHHGLQPRQGELLHLGAVPPLPRLGHGGSVHNPPPLLREFRPGLALENIVKTAAKFR